MVEKKKILTKNISNWNLILIILREDSDLFLTKGWQPLGHLLRIFAT